MYQETKLFRPVALALLLLLAFLALVAFALHQNPVNEPKKPETPAASQAQSTNDQPKTDLPKTDLPKAEQPKHTEHKEVEDPIADIRQRVAKEALEEVSEAELQRASRVLQFANDVETVISEGWFAQADRIAFFIRIYLGEWELALLPKVKIGRTKSMQRLLPPDKLFADELSQKLAEQRAQMAEHLDAMLKSYDELKKYVQDTSIVDEGLRGKSLAAQINTSYERFSKARKNYFSLLETESLPAEDLFLSQSPLRRQIIAARGIFALFAEITSQLSRETVSREAIIALQQRLTLLLAYAEEPPFKDSPLKERAYRAFLKTVRNYLADLDVGIVEGFYPHVRKALNNSQLACRASYNDFALYLNTH